MTVDLLMTMLAAGLVGFAVAAVLVRLRLAAPPAALMRINIRGRQVPAVLGGPLSVAGMATLASVALAGALGWDPARVGRMGAAVAWVVAVLAMAGGWDDRRGDEASRGFKGHLGALAAGRFTGGALKILAGGAAGVGAGLLLVIDDPGRVVGTVVVVAGAANVVNLFDRAPGRAAKVVLLVATPLMALGSDRWGVAAAGFVGALLACLPADLGEEAMLGDAGANPLGGLVGLGLAVSLPGWWLWVAAGVVVALNLASERWSFSQVIGATPWLDKLDRAGRK